MEILIETDKTVYANDDETGFTLAIAQEIARILRVMADDLERNGSVSPPRDRFGNVVGTVKIC